MKTTMHKSEARRLIVEAYRQMLGEFRRLVGPPALFDRVQILNVAKMAAAAKGHYS